MSSDRLLRLALGAITLIVAALVLVIVVFIAREAIGLLGKMGTSAFLFDAKWQPYAHHFGLQPMLFASFALMAGSVLVAAPAALLTAIFFNFYAGARLAVAGRRIMEVVAGIPSVVYGLWGLTVLVPVIARIAQPGASLLAGIVVLAIMIFPTIAVVVDAGLRALPAEYREGAEALALSRRCIAFSISLPAVRGSVVTGITLGATRAIGETMAVLMVTGNQVRIPGSVFEPVRALTSNIALEMAYALDEHRAALYVSCLFLLLLSVGLAIASQAGNRKEYANA